MYVTVYEISMPAAAVCSERLAPLPLPPKNLFDDRLFLLCCMMAAEDIKEEEEEEEEDNGVAEDNSVTLVISTLLSAMRGMMVRIAPINVFLRL